MSLRSPFRPGFTTDDAAELAGALKALGDPARLKILALLWEGPKPCVELQFPLGLAQPTVSHHLRILEAAGLIESRRDGHFVYRSLKPHALRELSGLLHPGGAA